MLSKKARQGITAFNRARDLRYSGKYIPLNISNPVDLYVKAYLGAKNDTNANKPREVAGEPVPEA